MRLLWDRYIRPFEMYKNLPESLQRSRRNARLAERRREKKVENQKGTGTVRHAIYNWADEFLAVCASLKKEEKKTVISKNLKGKPKQKTRRESEKKTKWDRKNAYVEFRHLNLICGVCIPDALSRLCSPFGTVREASMIGRPDWIGLDVRCSPRLSSCA